MKANLPIFRTATFAAGALALSACTVGPKYERPGTAAPPAFKEMSDEQRKSTAGWKSAEPHDDIVHGKWWEVFHDPLLNKLEEQVEVSNQNIAASFAQFMQARAMVREAKAGAFPTLSLSPQISAQHGSGTTTTTTTAGQLTTGSSTLSTYTIPLEASWAPDLWGRVRNAVSQTEALSQASAADLENEKLTEQAELATDYYLLRGQDVLQHVLDASAEAQRNSLKLTNDLYTTGIGAEGPVAQADAQLQTTLAQAIDVGINRANYEHAIAVLLGEAPSNFSIPQEAWKTQPVAIPYGVPSQLLERRPDVAAAERAMAAANAQIGIAIAAYFPNLTLSGAVGIGGSSVAGLLSAPSFFWSLGASLTQLIYDGGLRKATVDQYRAAYDQTVAQYRQAVLTAFQQVEDNLSTLRILSIELEQEARAVQASQKSLTIEQERYKLGLDPYLNVITAQLTLLSNQQTDAALRTKQITASIALIQALGGGWDTAMLPTREEAGAPPADKANEKP